MMKDFRESLAQDAQQLIGEIDRIADMTDRVRLAGFGLASPLLRMRERQQRREVERVARATDGDDPEVLARKLSVERVEAFRTRFNADLERTRIDAQDIDAEKAAGLRGRVVERGVAVTDVTVVARVAGRQVAFACANAGGAFAMSVPAPASILLSVMAKDGTELYRDLEPETLLPGEQAFREILLASATKPCPQPPEPPERPPTVAVPDLVGMPEATARKALLDVGLDIGERTTQVDPRRAGSILSQRPRLGQQVERGTRVDVVVGEARFAIVPQVVGLELARARHLLGEAGFGDPLVDEVDLPGARKGIVAAQSPVAGSRHNTAEPVQLSIGRRLDGEAARVARAAEDRLREGGIDRPSGWLGVALGDAEATSMQGITALLAEDRNEIKRRLGVPSLKVADKIRSALRIAMR